MPIKVLKKDENKTIPVSHSKDHPDVKTTEKNIKKDREKAKEDFPILSKVFGTGNPKKDTEKAKRVADTLQTMASKMRTETEGSFKKGGLSAGQKKIAAKAPPPDKITGADFAVLKKEKAKGRGMGLQDEKVKPGKVYKANKGMSFDEKMKAVDKGLLDKKTGKATSMEALRQLKGFKPGETASQFNKRRMALEVAKKAGKATTIGKAVLPIAAAGVAGAAYLKNKLKKEDKKMGGGMMNKPMGYKSGTMVKARGCKLGRTRPTKLY